MSKANKGKSSLQPPDLVFALCSYAAPDPVYTGEDSEECWCLKDIPLGKDSFLMPFFGPCVHLYQRSLLLAIQT